tara:strand:- start:7461 stop:7703 length:243 start_codon:yes stop_codon:yes gene_type:complete
MKVKVDKVEYEIKEVTLSERCEINDLLLEKADSPSFSLWVKVLQVCTELSDEEINAMESSHIIQLGSKCVDLVNKKKEMK